MTNTFREIVIEDIAKEINHALDVMNKSNNRSIIQECIYYIKLSKAMAERLNITKEVEAKIKER